MAKKAAKRTTGKAEGDGSGEAGNGRLFETQKAVSRRVRTRANRYKELSEEKSRIGSAFKAAQDDLIETMKDEGCERVDIELGGVRKWIVCEDEPKLHQETIKEQAEAEA